MEDCFICRKQAGAVAPPPGGYFYEDEHWLVCHAPAANAVRGQLFVESKRHFLDFAEMTPDEAASYGGLLSRLYGALKGATGAERVYAIMTLEGAPHFHVWLIPRAAGVPERGIGFLAQKHSTGEDDAVALVGELRAAIA